ncbi:AMP-binding protein [Bacillus thuringiensis]
MERTPDNIALEFGQISLTYRELNSKANYLGEVLRKTGVKPDSVVGITSERSLEMVIGIYGILKSGAAYLPIDPKSPRNRMEFIIKDSNIKIMLGGPGSKDLLNGLSDIVIVDITECNEERESNLKVISKPNHLAYVIYTSGTTGMPKGVMIENRNIVNQVFWQIENGNYTEKSVIVQKTAFFFDGSAWEIFPCSVAGCKLSILNEDQNKDPGNL